MNMIIVQTRFYGPTTHKGGRIKAWRLNYKPVWTPYDFSYSPRDNHANAARAAFDSYNFSGYEFEGMDWRDDRGYLVVFEDTSHDEA